MAPSERAHAGNAGPDDKRCGITNSTQPADNLPPNVVDLGNGEAVVIGGTAADFYAAAEWLARHHPDGVQGERFGPVHGPVLNMGASNAIAATTRYAATLPPTSMLVLNWMALVSLDTDPEPWWSQGHEVLATVPLGRREPVTVADLRAVERAITPLFEAGAITVDRHSSGRPGHPQHVRYRLWLTEPAPDEKRRASHRAAPDENRRTSGASARRKVVQHPTVFDQTPDENRRTKEEEEYEEYEISSPAEPTKAAELRPEVDELCEHLADRIERNGSLRPNITKRWRTAARLLIDNDGRTVRQVHNMIDWCQDDEFWRANIMSMPKLREKYDTLRQRAMATQRPAARPHQPTREELDQLRENWARPLDRLEIGS